MSNPALRIEEGRMYAVYFPSATAHEVEGKYGKQQVYDVECDGDLWSLYCAPGLYKELKALGFADGAVVNISRQGESTSTKWILGLKDAGEKSTGGSTSAAPVTRVAKATPDERVESYISCLKMSMRIWHNEDVRSGLAVLGVDQASADARLMALKDVATHMSMGMGREWTPTPPEPPQAEPQPQRQTDDKEDLPF